MLLILCGFSSYVDKQTWFKNQSQTNSALYSAFWSVELTDFKNVIVENIHWALSEDAKVTKVKRPRNPKQQKFYYEKS